MSPKKHWYDFLLKPAEVEAGPVKLRKIPVCFLVLIIAGIIIAGYFAFKVYMQTPEPIRHHKVNDVRGALK